MTQELTTFEIVPADLALPQEEKQSLIQSFSPLLVKARELLDESAGIKSAKLARVSRLSFRKLRSDSESLRKSLKEHHLRMGKAIDGAHNILVAAVQDAEKKMEEIEKAEERAEEERIEKLRRDRHDQLIQYGVHESIVNSPGLGRMEEAAFTGLLNDSKAMHEARVERERKEEEERLSKQVAEAQERERVRLENERLLKEAQEREAAAKAEREQREARLQEIQAIAHQASIAGAGRVGVRKGGTIECIKETLAETAQWEISEERFGDLTEMALKTRSATLDSIRSMLTAAEAEQRAEYERQAAQASQKEAEEKARKEREALEAKHRAEQAKAEAKAKQEREILERDAAIAKAQRDAAEAKARHIREEKERAEREAAEAAEAAALAPDKEKLIAMAKAIRSVPVPKVKAKKAVAALSQFITKLNNLADWVEEKAEEL